MKGKKENVLDFIRAIRESFIDSKKVYTQGSCYKFYTILKFIFPESNAYYDSNHVITEIRGRYYDITGEVQIDNHVLVDKHYLHHKLNKLIYDQENQ